MILLQFQPNHSQIYSVPQILVRQYQTEKFSTVCQVLKKSKRKNMCVCMCVYLCVYTLNDNDVTSIINL